jgi:hypothetical protein
VVVASDQTEMAASRLKGGTISASRKTLEPPMTDRHRQLAAEAVDAAERECREQKLLYRFGTSLAKASLDKHITAAIRTAVAEAQTEGMMLVPLEPDDAMIEAGFEELNDGREWGRKVSPVDVWEKMLAAAPRPDTNQEGAACPDALLPDGPVCPRCGKPRAASGINGGSWVHFPGSTEQPGAAPEQGGEVCQECGGDGIEAMTRDWSKDCPDCDGTGRIQPDNGKVCQACASQGLKLCSGGPGCRWETKAGTSPTQPDSDSWGKVHRDYRPDGEPPQYLPDLTAQPDSAPTILVAPCGSSNAIGMATYRSQKGPTIPLDGGEVGRLPGEHEIPISNEDFDALLRVQQQVPLADLEALERIVQSRVEDALSRPAPVTDDTVERAAKAICKDDSNYTWEKETDFQREWYRNLARAALQSQQEPRP